MKRFSLTLIMAALGVVMFAGNAMALLPLPSLPPASYPVAGESELTYLTYTVHVDWIVDLLDEEDGFYYLYLYQVENSLSLDVIDKFYIQPITGGAVLDFGWAQDEFGVLLDLDEDLDDGPIDPWYLGYNHDSSYFPNLSGEYEPTDGGLRPVYSADLAFGIGGWKLEWRFANEAYDGIPPGDESDTLWLVSEAPPGYYPGHADNTVTFDGDVPAPIPEPISLILLGGGLLSFALLGSARRRRIKA